HTYGLIGNYLVTLVATDPQTNCVNSAESTIFVEDSPPVNFTVNQTEGCIPANFVFTNLDNVPDVDLVWDFGDGQSSNQPGFIDHTYADTGCYTVTLTATNAVGCVSTFSNIDMVCVYENPIAFFTAEETIVPADDPYAYFINNSQFADTYVWDFGDGSTSFSENPVHLYPTGAANYDVLLTASNDAGCFDQFMLTIVLWEEELFYVPNSFTPNGDGSNDVFLPILTAGFDESSYQLLIFNRWGELVFESYDPSVGWDGTYGATQNFASQDGTYTWRILVRGLQDEDAQLFTGHVNLLK
ncbi:PKD domain-containing protein, partial [Crocinitomicaceae bacterium]|nr:PKD domain-containing protein [Crocinitomicaceae bacterium]